MEPTFFVQSVTKLLLVVISISAMLNIESNKIGQLVKDI